MIDIQSRISPINGYQSVCMTRLRKSVYEMLLQLTDTLKKIVHNFPWKRETGGKRKGRVLLVKTNRWSEVSSRKGLTWISGVYELFWIPLMVSLLDERLSLYLKHLFRNYLRAVQSTPVLGTNT